MAVIDLPHLYGIAAILDAVFNHASGFGDQCLHFPGRQLPRDNNCSLYSSSRNSNLSRPALLKPQGD